MGRRKRNHKQCPKKRHKTKSKKKTSKDADPRMLCFEDELRSCIEDESDEQSDTEFNLKIAQSDSSANALMNTTPVNKSKVLNSMKFESFNATNLNLLFNESNSFEGPLSRNDISEHNESLLSSSSSPSLLMNVSDSCTHDKKKGTTTSKGTTVKSTTCDKVTPNITKQKSSLSKLYSFDRKETNGRNVSIGTQTPSRNIEKFEGYFEKSNFALECKNICETPKISQADLLDMEQKVEDKLIYKTPLKKLATPNLSTPKLCHKNMWTPKMTSAEQKLTNVLNHLRDSEKLKRNVQFSSSQFLKSTNVSSSKTNNGNLINFETPSTRNKIETRGDREGSKSVNMSVSEMSFFSPDLYKLKSISTPIDKDLIQSKLFHAVSNTERCLRTALDARSERGWNTEIKKSKFIYNVHLPKCNEQKPFNVVNDLLKDNACTEKLNNSDMLLQVNKGKSNKTLSPKLRRCSPYTVTNCRDHITRYDYLSKSHGHIPRPASAIHHKTFERPKGVLNVSGQRHVSLFGRIRKIHTRYTSQWVTRLMEIASLLSCTVKRGFSRISERFSNKNIEPSSTANNSQDSSSHNPVYNNSVHNNSVHNKSAWNNSAYNKSALNNSACNNSAFNKSACNNSADKNAAYTNTTDKTSCCKCEEYKQTISHIQKDILEIKSSSWKMEKDMLEIKEYLKSLILRLPVDIPPPSSCKLEKEMMEIKEHLKSLISRPQTDNPPPPLARLPPPPPPLPPMLTLAPALKLKNTPKNTVEKKANESSRPTISRDDILKVKLRKITDKPVMTRRSTQPVISKAILSQVKLRPVTGRSQTALLLPEASTNCSSLPASPHTSLTRMLLNDSSVRRVKRLQRDRGYSTDNIFRRTHNFSRERDASENDSHLT